MRSFYTLFLSILCFLALPLTFHSQTLSADNDGDGCVATSDLMTLLSQFGECLSLSSFTCGDLIEHEGYSYSTVQIGDQCWFSENCRYLPSVTPGGTISSTIPYYYVYDYYGTDVEAAKATTNYQTNGVLYNWLAVMETGICPCGWHIPSDEEWQTMEMALGMSASEASSIGYRGTDQGSQMKSTTGWYDDGNGTNSSGFNALPSGLALYYGFDDVTSSYMWCSSQNFAENDAWRRTLNSWSDQVYRNETSTSFGHATRCIKD